MDAEVVGIATPQSGSSLKQQAAIFFSEHGAERLYAHAGEVDLFGVQLAAGADASDVSSAVRSTLGDDVSVLTGNKRGRAEFLDAAESNMRLIAISGSLGGIGLFVAVLVIAGMLSLFVQQRQREIALLRAMGATPRQVRRLIARETLIVTCVGAALGVWPGLWLASRLAEAMQGRGLLPGTFEIDPSGIPVVVAVGITLLASQISAYVAGRRAGRVRPVEALTAAAAPSARLGLVRCVAAAVAVAGTGALFLTTKSVRGSLAPAVALGLFCTAVVAVGLLAPLLVRAGLRVLALPVADVGRRWVSRCRQHAFAGAAVDVGGDTAGPHGCHRRHDRVPAVDARPRGAGPERRSGSWPITSSTPDQSGSDRMPSTISPTRVPER